jgi:hypothetical protein
MGHSSKKDDKPIPITSNKNTNSPKKLIRMTKGTTISTQKTISQTKMFGRKYMSSQKQPIN